MKTLRYGLEATLLYLLFGFFKLLPIESASNFGGWVGQTIGPRLATSRKALGNIQRALPDLSDEEHHQAIKEMWDNLGRIIAEYPHLEAIGKRYTVIENQEAFLNFSENNDHGVILFTAHISNWEIHAPAMLQQLGQEVDGTYRAPNNPWSDKMLAKARSLKGRLQAHAKSRSGGRALLGAMKQKRNIGILIDQKYNEGLAVPFFGISAMTNPIFVQLAQKYKCPLIPVRNERLGGPHFKLSFEKPIDVFDKEGKPLPMDEVIEKAHERLEHWVRKKPGQWLWLHRRWDSAKTAKERA